VYPLRRSLGLGVSTLALSRLFSFWSYGARAAVKEGTSAGTFLFLRAFRAACVRRRFSVEHSFEQVIGCLAILPMYVSDAFNHAFLSRQVTQTDRTLSDSRFVG
jgi:hypothetical protein